MPNEDSDVDDNNMSGAESQHSSGTYTCFSFVFVPWYKRIRCPLLSSLILSMHIQLWRVMIFVLIDKAEDKLFFIEVVQELFNFIEQGRQIVTPAKRM